MSVGGGGTWGRSRQALPGASTRVGVYVRPARSRSYRPGRVRKRLVPAVLSAATWNDTNAARSPQPMTRVYEAEAGVEGGATGTEGQ